MASKEKTDSIQQNTVGQLLSLGFWRDRGKATEVVIFAAIGDRLEVFCISAVCDADTGNLALLCHVYCLLLLYSGIIGKLIPGDSATLFHKPDDPLCIGISLRDLIQCIFDEIMIFHLVLPLSKVVFTCSKDGMQKSKKRSSLVRLKPRNS